MYAIIDIETTGRSPKFEKITEIAVFIHNGTEIVDEFTTLINPEKYIPAYITALTGITNEMVGDAPKFYEVAKKIVELTRNTTIIGHNVNFDYSFIKNEFKELGYHFQRDCLCTVKLSRKLIPGLRSYSLGNLCDELGISINGRHRASGDALATAKLFELLLNINAGHGLIHTGLATTMLKELNKSFRQEIISNLPEETGVYYFHNDHGDILYIGKSKNIKSRVISHLSDNSTKKAIELKQNVTDISFEITGSELIALLMESAEIKKYKPLYNRAQRRSLFMYGLYYFTDEKGYLNLAIKKNNEEKDAPVYSFTSKAEALDFLHQLIEKYELCQKLCGLYKSNGSCFYYELMECRGACIGIEPPEEYNFRVNNLLRSFSFEHNNTILLDIGRNRREYSIVKIENGKYIGFGYINSDEPITNPYALDDYITRYNDNHEVHAIIRQYLRKNKVLKKIEY